MSARPFGQLASHGTPARYRWHKRHGEDACQACLDGEAERQRLWKDRTAYSAVRRQRYATARAAGLSAREANEARDRRAA